MHMHVYVHVYIHIGICKKSARNSKGMFVYFVHTIYLSCSRDNYIITLLLKQMLILIKWDNDIVPCIFVTIIHVRK